MDLSTVLIISLFFYTAFMILLAIEYFTDKSRKQRAPDQKALLRKIDELKSSKLRIQNTAAKYGKTFLIGVLSLTVSQLLFFAAIYYHSDATTGRSWILFHSGDLIGATFFSIIGFLLIALSIFKGIIGQRAPPQEIQELEERNKATLPPLEDLEKGRTPEPEGEEPPADEKTSEAPAIWKEEKFE